MKNPLHVLHDSHQGYGATSGTISEDFGIVTRDTASKLSGVLGNLGRTDGRGFGNVHDC